MENENVFSGTSINTSEYHEFLEVRYQRTSSLIWYVFHPYPKEKADWECFQFSNSTTTFISPCFTFTQSNTFTLGSCSVKPWSFSCWPLSNSVEQLGVHFLGQGRIDGDCWVKCKPAFVIHWIMENISSISMRPKCGKVICWSAGQRKQHKAVPLKKVWQSASNCYWSLD